MKFKNIEDVWAYAKNKLVNAQISSIQKTGSSKFFDLTVPKSMVKKFPEDCNRQDLNYTITQTGSNVDYFLENNGWEGSLVDTSDFFDAISGWCGINESEEETMNQNAIIGVESSHRYGFDKTITFSYYTSRADLEKQFKKIGKPYALDVLPSDEAEVHVKNADVDKFKGVISALHEKIDTSMNMCMMEGITIKGRPVPDIMRADFSSGEVSFINSTIGKTWYQITPKSKVWKDMNDLMKKSKKSSSKMIDGCNYTIYEAPKGTTFMFMDLGMGAEAFLIGQSNINESEAQDKYREFFENKLKQWNISSPSELTQEDRSKFFTEIREEWKKQKNVNESFIEDGYEILTQDEFRQEFGGNGNLASYALYALYNTRLIVKCTPDNPNYSRIVAFAESLPDIIANDKQGIKCYRQTDSNLIIIYEGNVYWSYNTGTNLALLNEAELVKGLGKVFDTLSDTGTMSDNAVRAAIEALGGTMSELSLNPTTNSIKAYKTCEDEYQCLIGELEKRGLRPVNR